MIRARGLTIVFAACLGACITALAFLGLRPGTAEQEPRATSHARGGDQDELERLQSEVRGLKRTVAALASAQRGNASGSQPQVAEDDGTEAPPRPRKEPRRPLSFPKSGPVPAGAVRFEADGEDPQWAERAQANVRAALEETDLRGAKVTDVTCKSTVCRVSLIEGMPEIDADDMTSLLGPDLAITEASGYQPAPGSEDMRMRHFLFFDRLPEE